MKSSEGIQKFIEHKRSIEKERPLLTAEPNLITIDGVDGSGKSTIVRKLVEKLQERFGKDRVVLADITNLRGSPKQEKLYGVTKQENITESRLDILYVAGVNRAYEELVIPALHEGKIVVVDRSEVDLLRYTIGHGDKALVEKRKTYIQNGTVTHRLWAGNRIFLEADPNDAWENLKSREQKSKYDPVSLQEAEISSKAQKEAEEYIESLPYQGAVQIVREKVRRIEGIKERKEYLDGLIEKLSASLDLSEKKNGDK